MDDGYMSESNVESIGEFPTPTDAVLSAVYTALVSGRGLNKVDVAAHCGMTKTMIYDRLKGGSSWRASEAQAIADFFHVRIGDLYDGLNGQFGPEERRRTNPCMSDRNADVIPIRINATQGVQRQTA